MLWTTGIAMRNTSLGVAAFLAVLMAVPAMAFEFDSTGGSTPGVGTNYADPYGMTPSKFDDKADAPEAPNGTRVLQGMQLSVSGGKTSSSVSGGAMGWTNPQPGRLSKF
jgi:hypothetical protein